MNKISEITWQDILDIINDGFIEELEEPVFNDNVGEYVT